MGSYRIQTNKINANLRADLLSAKYEVFNVKTTEKHFGKGNNAAKLVDDFTNKSFVLSVVYERGNSFYMLLNKSIENKININKTLKLLSGAENISLEEVAIARVPQHIMVQLLMNSLGTFEGKILGFHNVTGHFYIHHHSWAKSQNKQIVTLELKISKDMLLDWNVRTFTSVSLKNLIIFGKKKFQDYPEYEFGKDNILKRIEKGSNPNAYILRQIGDQKNNIKFLEIDNIEKFKKTKMGVLCDCIDKFNTKFNGLAHLEFDSFSDFNHIEVSQKLVKEMNSRFNDIASKHNVVLIDKVNDMSESSIKILKQQFAKQFNCKVSVLKKPKEDAINIVLIHEDEWYKDKKDPHDIVYEGCAVQHITIESVAHLANKEKVEDSDWKPLLDCIMQEVLIKKDLVKNRITLTDWGSYGYSENIDFGICHKKDDDTKHFYFMTIFPTGEFVIKEQENNLFEQDNYQECINIFEIDDVVGIVRVGEDINVIHDTKLRTIPEIDLIRDLLNNGDNYLRSKERREELFPAITNIKCFAKNDYSLNYFSGIIGEGMRRVIQTAANVRLVDTYLNSKLFFDNMLKLMAVTFVRNGQLTVMPFPFKYLLEYARAIHSSKGSK